MTQHENKFQNNNIQIKSITELEALDIIFRNHYSKIMPRLTTYRLGGYIGDKCIGVVTLGHGVRPVHTIRKLFPSLSTKDYFEIGKMALENGLPKNTTYAFLSKVIQWLKINEPKRKILFTWADGILGKIGTVYMSSNFLYGGFIWTDLYVTDKGEKVHPGTSQGLTDKGDKVCGHRPTKELLKKQGWYHYKGKQFRYLYFLCDKKEKKKLLKETSFDWSINYPTKEDLQWQLQDLDSGDWKFVDKMYYDPSVTSLANKKAMDNKNKIKSMETSKNFFNF